MDSAPQDLHCPISLQLFEDPISTPCCGQTLSRISMQDHLSQDDTCPLCRSSMWEFPEFDVNSVPRNRTIAGLVDALRAGTGGTLPSTVGHTRADAVHSHVAARDEGPKLRCALTSCHVGGRPLPVGRLQVDVEWPSYEGDVCLFIPVIDKSGSMSGQPFEQVKTALLHMLDQTLTNRSVFTCIIPYDSHAEVMKVPRDGGAETERWRQTQARIRNMTAGGGTSFGNAFSKIKEVLFGDTSNGQVRAQAFEAGTPEFEAQRRLGRQGLLVQGAPAFVKSVVIVFMTDGQDNTRANRSQMVQHLQSILAQWTKHVVVHTVGFSKDHDFKFLDDLRKVGCVEGTFRFAEPSDGPDALCSKLAELTDSIVASTCLGLSIDPSPMTFWDRNSRSGCVEQQVLMRDGLGTLRTFVVVDGTELTGHHIRISIPGKKVRGEEMEYEAVVTFDGTADWLDQWRSQLVEEVVTEVTTLATKSTAKSLPEKLHLAFLLQRSSFLELCLEDAGTKAQLQLCTKQAVSMLHGSEANVARLVDAKSSATPAPIQQVAPASPGSGTRTTEHPRTNVPVSRQCDDGRGRIFAQREGKSELHVAVFCLSTDAIAKCLRTADPCLTDEEGDSALAAAAAIGRLNAVKLLLADPCVVEQCLKRANDRGETPLELAASRGHWNTMEALLEAGAGKGISTSKAERLLQCLLRRGFYKTAATMVTKGLCLVSLDALRDRMPAETLRWIMQRQAEAELLSSSETLPERQRLYLQRGVENGMEDLVRQLLGKGACPDSSDDFEALLLTACELADTAAGIRIVEQLFSASKDIKAWSLGRTLVTAAARGWLPQLELVLDRSATSVDWQDDRGRTPLLAACAERQREMIIALVNRNASRALADSSGCTPLVASVRRNHCAAVAVLLEAYAPVLVRSHGEVSALHACCELGRPENLEMLLKHVRRVEPRAKVLQEFASLGLLQLAIEGGRLECLKVLLGHGALEAPYPKEKLPLHTAARAGSCESARLLLEAKASINERGSRGSTPLHVAVQHGHAMVVRLLRTFGADVEASDDTGCVAACYCDGAARGAQSIRCELVDPMCEHLMAAACSADEACRSVLRFAGLPGLLPARRCLDVHMGDKWTPLMQAVVCGNIEFASCLLEADADVHREDRHGLSAMFWIKALHGQELAARLVPEPRSEDDHLVQCKDGELRISAEARTWMEGNFPAVAAQAVSRATLEVTLKAQGFPVLETVPGETVGLFTQSEVEALEALEEARRCNVREGLVFQCAACASSASFQEGAFRGTVSREVQKDRLQLALDLVPANSSSRLSELMSGGDLTISVVDFLRGERLPDSACLECCSLAAVATVASPQGRGVLSLQQSLLLHSCLHEPQLLCKLNAAICGHHSLKHWRPLAKALLQALNALDPQPATVFKLLPGRGKDVFEEGQLLSWSGVLLASTIEDVLAADAEESSTGILCCIKASSGRSWSTLTRLPSPERAILPRTVFRVVSVAGVAELDLRHDALAGCEVITLEEVDEGAHPTASGGAESKGDTNFA